MFIRLEDAQALEHVPRHFPRIPSSPATNSRSWCCGKLGPANTNVGPTLSSQSVCWSSPRSRTVCALDLLRCTEIWQPTDVMGHSQHIHDVRAMSVYTQHRTYHCTAPNVATGHVWTAPSWQGFSSRVQDWSVRPCVRSLSAVHVTAGHNALRGSGPGQKDAFDNAVAHVGCPDRRIDRLCITCCPPSQPSHHAGYPVRDLVQAASAGMDSLMRPEARTSGMEPNDTD